MQFHEKKDFIFDFTSFFAWTILSFLARSAFLPHYCCEFRIKKFFFVFFRSETGFLEVVKILVEFGNANPMVKNNTGLTPLMAAAEHCQIPVFDYLFERCSVILSQEEKIDALELLGKL